MVLASKLPARFVKALPTGAVWVSRGLSVAALLGIACVPFLPLLAPRGVAAPVEVVRTVPVPYLDAAPSEPPAPVVKVAERRSARSSQPASRRSKGDKVEAAKAKASADDDKAAAKAPADAKADAKKDAAPEPDVWSDPEIVAALRDCLRRLAPLDVEIEVAEPVKKDRCGAAAPIVLKRIGMGDDGVDFRPAPTLNCAMVEHLYAWVEETLQPAARELLGSPVVRIRNASGYACRNRVGAGSRSDRLSEHALANAIDIASFETADGRTVDVLSRWGPTRRDLREAQEHAWNAAQEAKAAARQAEREAAKAARAARTAKPGDKRNEAAAEAAKKKEEAARMLEEARRKEAEWRKALARTAEMRKLRQGADAESIQVTRVSDKDEEIDPAEAVFLRRLHKGACGTFGTVLGPEANEAHRNHFHFDLIPRKRSAYCR